MTKDLANRVGNGPLLTPRDVRAVRRADELRDAGERRGVEVDEPPAHAHVGAGLAGTRREEMLLSPDVMRQVILLRKMLSAVGQIEGTELLLQRLGKTKTNKEFLSSIAKAMEADSKS